MDNSIVLNQCSFGNAVHFFLKEVKTFGKTVDREDKKDYKSRERYMREIYLPKRQRNNIA